jgi:multicomponent Na+:H+ antiporter subunit C
MSYITSVVLLSIGLLILLTTSNLLKKIVGLGIFQSAILLFYISLGKVDGGLPPIIQQSHGLDQSYSSPLPQVLMLTAIVVGMATFAVAISFIARIKEQFGTIEEDKILEKMEEDESAS